MNRNVYRLAVCQGLFQTCAVINVSLAGIIGQELAPEKGLATLPATSGVIGGAVMTIPAALLMQRLGRRAGFTAGALFGVAAGAMAAVGILSRSFPLFCAGAFSLGMYQAHAQYYRFAAAELALPEERGKAISFVTAAGVFAAILGPQIARGTRDFGALGFAPPYLAVLLVSLIALFAVRGVPFPPVQTAADRNGARPLGEIARQPAFGVAVLGCAVGFGVMSLAMTATPIAMVGHHHTVSDATVVIQWHVLGMFVPSFFTGRLIARHGVEKVMLAGVGLLLGHVVIALSGIEFFHYLSALVLLGVGWNFLYVGGSTLLTETYRPSERGKAQATNDFIVAGVLALASFSSGKLLHELGWQAVNRVAIPFLVLTGLAVAGLAISRRRTPAAKAI